MAGDWKKGATLEKIEAAQSGILAGFKWCETEEGVAFWSRVHDILWKMNLDLKADRVVQKLSGDTGD